MKISVIVAVYNIVDYIDQCVESIVNQTYKNIEIILVNDGSTDASLSKLLYWKEIDSRITVIDKANGGLSSARNAGMENVSGDYVSFIDGDDWIDLSLFEKLTHVIKPDTDMIVFPFIKFFNKERMIYSSFASKTFKSGADFMEGKEFDVMAWNKLYKLSILKEHRARFIEGLLHEDITFTIPLVLICKNIISIDSVFYYYRQNRENAITTVFKEKNIHDILYSIRFLIDHSKVVYGGRNKVLNNRIALELKSLHWKLYGFGKLKWFFVEYDKQIKRASFLKEVFCNSDYNSFFNNLSLIYLYKVNYYILSKYAKIFKWSVSIYRGNI
ncbi:glycosyltransferase [Sphingobacterium multivorum]|uniref:glycosyltransferase n=1 Tax=Sphingobacterium multivorum TaxID=28454 RepID=UPI0028A1EBC5|nr:glycosyltransferase [Sphingobacterium multivorum]